MFTTALNARFVCTGTRRFRCSSFLSTLLAAGAMLLGSVGGVYAQFPAAAENESTFSIGVFRIDTITSTLTPAQLSALFDQGSSPYAYPGWNPVAKTLTSPVLFDSDTRIAVGGASRRLISDYPSVMEPRYLGFPQTVGAVGVSVPPLSLPLTADTILGYSDYGGILPNSGHFSGQPPVDTGPRECLTEIQAFNLTSFGLCSNQCPPQAAQICGLGYYTGTDTIMVRAGYNNIYNGGASFSATGLGHSLGMVDAVSNSGLLADDFPAYSFFDIYPEITLPPVNNTVFSYPTIPLSGAVLTTVGLPLIIESYIPLGSSLPPNVVYKHETTDFGVDLVFKTTGPINTGTGQPYWSAGDVLGTVTLAGHNPGVSDPCAKGVAITTFIDAVLGPVNQLAPSAVIGLIYGNADFPPSPTSSYASAVGTNYDGSSLDLVQFTNGVTTLFVRNFKFSNFIIPISLPAFGSSVTYTNTNTVVSLETSTDAHNFISGSATGQVQILIINTNLPTAPSKVFYYAQLKSFNGSGTTQAGSFKFRQSPTKISPGLLIVQTNSVNNYKIGGNLNASFDWSFNGGITYTNANRPIQLTLQTVVDCGSVQPKLTIVMLSPGIARITWNSGSYRLLSTPSLTPPVVWTDVPVTSPYIFSISPTTSLFYRLACP